MKAPFACLPLKNPVCHARLRPLSYNSEKQKTHHDDAKDIDANEEKGHEKTEPCSHKKPKSP